MPASPYREETYNMTLEAVGHPEFKLEVLDPEYVEATERNHVVDAMTILHYRQYTKSGLPPDERWAIRALEKFVLDSIKSWNLVFPPRWKAVLERGTVIPLTREDRVASFAKLLVEDGNNKDEALATAEAITDETWDPFGPLPGYIYKAVVGPIGGRLLEPPKSAEGDDKAVRPAGGTLP